MRSFQRPGDHIVVVFEGIPWRGLRALEVFCWKQRVRDAKEENYGAMLS